MSFPVYFVVDVVNCLTQRAVAFSAILVISIIPGVKPRKPAKGSKDLERFNAKEGPLVAFLNGNYFKEANLVAGVSRDGAGGDSVVSYVLWLRLC